jgi:hypothetical protein
MTDRVFGQRDVNNSVHDETLLTTKDDNVEMGSLTMSKNCLTSLGIGLAVVNFINKFTQSFSFAAQLLFHQKIFDINCASWHAKSVVFFIIHSTP